MFKKNETGFLSILYSIGPKPLQSWDSSVKNGHIKRVNDVELQSSVIELIGANVNNNYICCPSEPHMTLGIRMPTIVLLVKNLQKYFTFEIQVLDDKNYKRTFKMCNYQSNTRVKSTLCIVPMKLVDGWNLLHFNLSDFTNRAFGTNYEETLKLRRIYFTDQPLNSKKIPPEFKAFAAVEEDGSSEKNNAILEETLNA